LDIHKNLGFSGRGTVYFENQETFDKSINGSLVLVLKLLACIPNTGKQYKINRITVESQLTLKTSTIGWPQTG